MYLLHIRGLVLWLLLCDIVMLHSETVVKLLYYTHAYLITLSLTIVTDN